MEKVIVENAIIEEVHLGHVETGVPMASILLEYNEGKQCFGNFYCLVDEGMSIFVMGVIDTVGVRYWEDLKGKIVRVRHTDSKIFEIGHPIKDRWFDPEQAFAEYRAKHPRD